MRKVTILINPSRSYTRGILKGIARFSSIQGLWTMYRPLEYRESKRRHKLIQVLKDLKPDGILMREPKEIDEIRKLRIPTIIFPYTQNSISGFVNVAVDHVAVGEMAAHHFLQKGYKRFAYCGFDDWWWSRERRDGFCEIIKQKGYEPLIYHPPKAKSHRSWEKELPLIAVWLTNLPHPVGVLACNDDRGELVIEACKIVGLSVPDQIAVLGVDNDELVCDLSSPPLSSIQLSLERAGYDAAALLDSMMSSKFIRKDKEQSITIHPMHVIERQSTDILAIEDPDLAAAIRFIRQHTKKPLQVIDVVEHVNISRRVMEKRFRKLLGHSIQSEICCARIGYITKLLVETQMPVTEIAYIMGFPGNSQLSRYFSKAIGMSPIAYRQKYCS